MWEMWGLGMGWIITLNANLQFLNSQYYRWDGRKVDQTTPGRHWDAYFSALHLAKEKEPTIDGPCMWLHCALWFCDAHQSSWFYSCMASFVIADHLSQHSAEEKWICYSCMASIGVDHLVQHGAEEKWISRWARVMYCLCSAAHNIVWVQHQFQMTRETQTGSHVIHTFWSRL